jgi:hypothetical protein
MTLLASRCRLAAPFAFLLAGAVAQSQWLPMDVLSSPPGRDDFALTPIGNGNLLLVGGDAASPSAADWLWNGLAWQPTTLPFPRRDAPVVARDDAAGAVWLFGGRSAAGATLSDTWLLSGGVWSQLAAATAPTTRAIGMAYHARESCMVLVTEAAVLPTLTNYETWKWQAGAWSLAGTFSLVGETVRAVVADTLRGEALVVAAGSASTSIRRLVGATWQPLGQFAGGAAALRAGFDPARGRLVIASAPIAGPGATFEGDGASMGQVGSAPSFPDAAAAIAYEPSRREVTLAARTAAGIAVSRWGAGATPYAQAFGAPCPNGFALALQPGDQPELGGVHRLTGSAWPAPGLGVSALGFSRTASNGVPLPSPTPFGVTGCLLRVDPYFLSPFASPTPPTQAITVPYVTALQGVRYYAQLALLDAAGQLFSSNGLEVQIGLTPPSVPFVETFANDLLRDPIASGDVWAGGVVAPARLGDDGRHGSFRPEFGASLGGGVYEWNLDQPGGIAIPAANTPSGQAFAVTDGRFYFTDLTVPAGITIRFRGSVAPRFFVRGRVDVRGTLDVSAPDMPATVPVGGPLAGQRLSSFNSRGGVGTLVIVDGQPGGAGGPGGGAGGAGGRECPPGATPAGPLNRGQNGQDVRVAAGHAYAGSVANTGGRGAAERPAGGTRAAASAPFIAATSLTFHDEFSPGGGGGGFLLVGGQPAMPMIPPPAIRQPDSGPLAAGGVSFSLLPYPPIAAPVGYQSLDHFLVGGAGGGGGGSHTFSVATVFNDDYIAGHGGTGGGGALALRAGGAVVINASGQLLARGGRGVLITGDNLSTTSAAQDIDWGVSSPGGGGAGGSVLLQSARDLTVLGLLDAGGAAGSRVGNVVTALAPTQLDVQAQGGAGSPGFYRLEAGGALTFAPTNSPVPAYDPAQNAGPLADVDVRSGSRSLWLPVTSGAAPLYRRYEVLATVGGAQVVFSDDPAVSAQPASGPGAVVQLRCQGALRDPATGLPLAGSEGPWRSTLALGPDSLNRDRAQLVRFDLVVDASLGPVVVQEVRLVLAP